MSLQPKRIEVPKYEIQYHRDKDTTIESDPDKKLCSLADTAA